MLKMQIENMKQDKLMIDASCDTNDLIQVVDTHATKYMIDDSLTSYEMESFTFISSELMKVDEPQAANCNAQKDVQRHTTIEVNMNLKVFLL
jgi:hypothetical protein